MSKEMITSGQQEAGISLVVAAARKAATEAIKELSKSGVLNVGNFQRGVLAQGSKIKAAVKAAVKTALAELSENVVGRIKRLFLEETIKLLATDGRETLVEASDVFTFGISYAKKRNSCKPTKQITVDVYELVSDGTYEQIFGGFGENLKRLCFTESQIVAFCRNYRHLLNRDGHGTFFLFGGEQGGFFVAGVFVCNDDGQLDLLVDPLWENDIFSAEDRHRFVVPQL